MRGSRRSARQTHPPEPRSLLNDSFLFSAIPLSSRTNWRALGNFLQQIPFNLLTAIDSGEDETAKRYGVKDTPALIVIGRDGRIAWNSRQVSKEDGLQSLERAARSLSVPWPIDEKQPQDKLLEQVSQLQGFLFGEAIDRALAKP